MANIVETAQKAGTFGTLVKAVEAAGLSQTLTGPGPFTVFAPTDEAFNKLPPGTLDAVLKDRVKLASILKYHVVPGRMMAQDVARSRTLGTAQGQAIRVDATHGVKVDNATVVKADIVADNGVIHVIDHVIMPQ